MATSISTRALSPRLAVLIAAVANLAGAFATTAVAKTVGKGIIDTGLATEKTVLAALFGAIVWNLLTWWLGLPSSSSHALIGGLVGAALVQSGRTASMARDRAQGVLPALGRRRSPSPVAFVLVADLLGVPRLTPGFANRSFRLGQLVTGTWVGFAHGANDAQKTMGVIALALYTHGSSQPFYIPTWVKLAAGLTIAAGTYSGGWRIIRTLGQRVYQMEPGRVRRAGDAGRGLRRHHYGYPLSTTHVVSGAVMGSGATRRFSAVRWGVAGNIVVAWILTIPAAALVAAASTSPSPGSSRRAA